MPNTGKHLDKHNPGSFCWAELATTDQTAAKKFYGALFGWSAEDSPMGPGDYYTMFQLEGRYTGAGYTLRADEKALGIPPHWKLYITVDDAEAAAARTAEVGGTVLAPAFDVMGHGRMAVLQDPTGGTFCIWQPQSHTGFGIAGVAGTFCWADLSTNDPDRAGKFYTDLFGWKLIKDDSGTHGDPAYIHIQNGEEFIGGIPPAKYRDPNMPAYWMAYFYVPDCAASTAKATELGAKVMMGPEKMMNVGTMSIITDPQGATFALFTPNAKG